MLTAATGLDPIVVLALTTLTFAGAGWLAGPFAGNAVFMMRYRGLRTEIATVSHALLLI